MFTYYALLAYLKMPEAQEAVLLPAAMTLLGLWRMPARERPVAFLLLILSTVFSLLSARWEVTSETRELFILPWSFLGVALLLWVNVAISSSTAFAITFLSLWSTDMVKAAQLVVAHEVSWQTFYFGVGGAGLHDGLVIFPVLAATLVCYSQWRDARKGILPAAALYQSAWRYTEQDNYLGFFP